ncbi:RNA polymerase I-specific transcription initiation factor RRN3 [Spatholobus suberectus]|nr:RNA polymerase I-specific transcription initiation factor RRN3 [Spatholobus suberectus]
MENGDFSDLQLIHHIRGVLVAVTTGDRENYDELVGYLHPKKNLNPDEVAILVTTLKALSGAASYIDSVHHEALLFAVSRMSLWNYGTVVMDALLELIISLAASNGKYIDWCLEMLVKHFVPPFYLLDSLKQENGIDRKNKVLSRVHAALKEIADLVPLSPLRLSPIIVQKMPSVFSKESEIVMYVENMLRLESGAIGEIVGSTMLPALVDRLLELDVEIGWDGMLQEDAKGIFEMELEDVTEFADEDENCDSMPPSESLNRKSLQGNLVVEKLDGLIVLAFLHLESCQSSDRLAEVFDVLLASFQKTVLNAYKSKFTQFVMFYACALDPEGCGVKFAMVLTDMFACDVNPPITRMSAVAYLASYLSRAKFLSAALVTSIIQSYIKPHFVRWSKVRTTYDDDDNDEVSDSGSEVSDDDFVDRNTKDMIDDDMMVSVEGLDFPDLNKMSITPKKSFKYGFETQLEQCMRMPARIRPSTSPESL